MPAVRDYYEVLGVSRSATRDEIKKAYRKIAVRDHPDRNKGDKQAEERFKSAAEAYAVLSDADKRARYDRFGHGGVGAGAGGGAAGFDPEVFSDFADILGDFFGFGDAFGTRGSRRRAQRGTPGADLRYELTLTLEEAAFGAEKTLEVPRLEACSACNGTGGAGGAAPVTCDDCKGHGQVRFTQGFFTVARACPRCAGRGTVVADPCPECAGACRIERRRKVGVGVPAGVDTGTRLRRVGEGEHGLDGGRTGDLYIDIIIVPHERFHRRGADVYSELAISYPQAVLGSDLEAETLHGPVELEIPAGTPPGTEFKLRGKGMARLDGRGRGHHIVRLTLDVPHPRDLDEDRLDLLRRLAEADGHEVREGRGVLDRVRDLFG